jgi:hypothetical protein
MKRITPGCAIAGISLVGLLLVSNVAFAQELSTQWWQWSLSIPPAVNPATDTTGEHCVVGQRGSTWFLAGVFGGGTATRTCLMPEGTTLFFPILNSVNVNTPNVCGQDANNIPVATLRAQIAPFIGGASALALEVDGKPVTNFEHIKSPVFEVALPEDNVFDAPCADFGGVPAGIYSPAVADGFYVRLAPLNVGNHTIHFHAENTDAGFLEDVTYHLIVVPVSQR